MKEMRRSPALIALLAATGLSGCSHHAKPATGPAVLPANLQADFTPDQTANCPQVAVLEQAQTLTLFAPGRGDVGGEVSTAQITGLNGACVVNTKTNTITVSLNPVLLADNGPANHGAALSLPWFVSLTQGDQVIDKHVYATTLKFDGNATQAGAEGQRVKIELPNSPDSAAVDVLVGFQETPDQLAYAAAHPNAAP
ncbi:hypothetical protein [Acidocella sp.]|uniref:hypothetical protein n=1 Tax=Acidocella sp. TaxID=50710 RepID=UPI0026064F2A|nr:hypothetical protein [Acidocella sp.]